MLPTIIGISGRKYHGKDTMADYLVEKYGYEKISFASPIKEISGILFGFSHEQLHGGLKETIDPRWGVSPRQVMQFIGTELFRRNIGRLLPDIGENFWVHCVLNKIKDQLYVNPNSKFVISDIRFPNEAESIKALSLQDPKIITKTFRIVRPDVSDNPESLHLSEILIDTLEVDKVVINDSSIHSLYSKIDSMIN